MVFWRVLESPRKTNFKSRAFVTFQSTGAPNRRVIFALSVVDVNECASGQHNCQQGCVNDAGGFR